MCRNAQRRHIHTNLENEDPSKIWKFLRTLGVGKSHQSNISKHLNIDVLNQHFSVSTDFDGPIKAATVAYLSNISTPNHSCFVFKQFTDCDVKRGINSITSNAVGSDCISRRMISLVLDEILPVFVYILNDSITSGIFPSSWKEAQIVPLPKKSNPSSLSDYRPISILPFLSKLLERMVHQQLTSFLIKNNLLNPFQSGFRPGHSTTTALVKITDDIREGMDVGKLTLLALLDFSNAFNNVDFDVLLGIMRSLNISPAVIEWFRSYLNGRRQRVRIDENFSSWCNTTAGVPQGGVLSPLLFSIFINSISHQLSCSYHLYADDLQIYTQTNLNDLVAGIDTINTDLEKIRDWSYAYGLKINPSKTQIIIIGGSRMISKIDWFRLPQFVFDGTNIPISDTVKNLGVFLDKQLSWTTQIAEVSRKIFATASSLRRLRNILPTTTKIALAQSLLLPILDYADISYLDLTQEQLDKLERLQNLCIRFIFGLRKYDHISEYRKKLKWLPIRLRRNTHTLSLLYNILFNPYTPSYLKDRFQFLHDSHSLNLRSSDNLKLQVPARVSQYYGKSFTAQAVRLWNTLPLDVKRAKSIHIFNKMVKTHYLSDLV